MADPSTSTADAAAALVATLEQKRARVEEDCARLAQQLVERHRQLESLRKELEGVERASQRLAEAEALAPEPAWDKLCSATAPAAVVTFSVVASASAPQKASSSSSSQPSSAAASPARGRQQQQQAAPSRRVVVDTVTVGVQEDSPLAGRCVEVTLGETVRTVGAYLRGGGFVPPGSTEGLTEVLHTALDLGLDELAQMVRDFVVGLAEAA
jgi:hypothetical protein